MPAARLFLSTSTYSDLRKGELQTGRNNKRSLCCAFSHSPLSPLLCLQRGRASRAGAGLPRITKHMRLRPVRRLNKPIVPARSAENHAARGRQPGPVKYASAWTWRRNAIGLFPLCPSLIHGPMKFLNTFFGAPVQIHQRQLFSNTVRLRPVS